MLVTVMLGIIIYFNYYHPHGIKPGAGKSWLTGFIAYYLIFFIPFATAYFLQGFYFKEKAYLKNKWFWIILLIAPAIFSFRVNFNFHNGLVQQLWKGDEQLFWLHCSKWFVGLFAAIIPVFVIWKIKDSNTTSFYGTAPVKNIKPYLVLILIMVPLVMLAATRADFLKMYPRAQVVSGWQLHPKVLYYLLHEIFYSLDFITIEIFFRGFLIISLINICGRHCIIPAACFYCCIHLGKPMGEAISSFAGGLLLGIISYNTNSIRGGLIVHIGIAWLMEIAGFISHQF